MFKIIEKDITNEATIRTPAYAKYYAVINSVSDIKKVFNFITKNELKFKILGNGSNILFSKDYYDDILFLKLGDGFKNFDLFNDYVQIGGTYSLIQAGRKLIAEGYKDYIFLI